MNVHFIVFIEIMIFATESVHNEAALKRNIVDMRSSYLQRNVTQQTTCAQEFFLISHALTLF